MTRFCITGPSSSIPTEPPVRIRKQARKRRSRTGSRHADERRADGGRGRPLAVGALTHDVLARGAAAAGASHDAWPRVSIQVPRTCARARARNAHTRHARTHAVRTHALANARTRAVLLGRRDAARKSAWVLCRGGSSPFAHVQHTSAARRRHDLSPRFDHGCAQLRLLGGRERPRAGRSVRVGARRR
jgi:hypothetical protein